MKFTEKQKDFQKHSKDNYWFGKNGCLIVSLKYNVFYDFTEKYLYGVGLKMKSITSQL